MAIKMARTINKPPTSSAVATVYSWKVGRFIAVHHQLPGIWSQDSEKAWHWSLGRATEKGGEPPNVVDVLLLRMRGEAAHHHVMLHALAQRCDRAVSW
jgi:hypothetical protein